MAILLTANSQEDFTPITLLTTAPGLGNVVPITTLSTLFNPANARSAIVCVFGDSDAKTATHTPVSDVWLHFVMYATSSSNTVDPVVVWRSAANADASQIRLKKTAATTFQFQTSPNGGSTWTNIGTTFVLANSTLHTIDVHITFHATTGVIQLWANEISLMSFSGAVQSQNNVVDHVVFLSDSSTAAKYYSEVCIADEDTRGFVVVTTYPTATGFHTGWFGDHSLISNAGAQKENYVSADVGLIATYDFSDLPTSYRNRRVKNHSVTVHGLVAQGAVADVQGMVRVSGADYTTANLGIAAGAGVGYVRTNYTTNPHTGIAWYPFQINESETGVKTV
jgi:hypothetical protein